MEMRSWLLRLCVLALAFAGCAQVLGFGDDYTLGAGGGGGGSTGGGSAGGGGAGGGLCEHATWPARPSATDPGPSDV